MVVTFYRRHSGFHSPNAFFVPKRSCLFLVRQPHVVGVLIQRLKRNFNPLPSCEGRRAASAAGRCCCPISIHSPHARGDHAFFLHYFTQSCISIHSPHARGDSISLQKSIQIYVSLHNKNMIPRFLELNKPLLAAQNPIFRVRSPRKSHDSFTFARPSEGRGITP